MRAQVPVRLANELINVLMSKPRVIYAAPEAYGAFLRGVPIYVAWYNSTLTADLEAARTPEAVNKVMDLQRGDFIITESHPDENNYLKSTFAKVRAYAATHADHVASIGSVSIYKIRPH